MFQTSAPFPISVIIDELSSMLNGEYPPHKPRNTDRTVVLAREVKAYTDNKIDMRNASAIKPIISGTTRFKARYGHPGREKYPLSRNLKFDAKFDQGWGYSIFRYAEVP
jgi:hypothetical protein